MTILVPNVVHCKKDKYTLYIGRPSKWGNPYTFKSGTLGKFIVKSREESIIEFEKYARDNLWNDLFELNNQTLGCWCKPLSCHGDILVKLFKEKFGVNS